MTTTDYASPERQVTVRIDFISGEPLTEEEVRRHVLLRLDALDEIPTPELLYCYAPLRLVPEHMHAEIARQNHEVDAELQRRRVYRTLIVDYPQR
jgi:hypothetical protein